MPACDRLFKYEITDQLTAMGLDATDRFHIHYVVHDLDGTVLGDHQLGNATIVHSVGSGRPRHHRPQVGPATIVHR